MKQFDIDHPAVEAGVEALFGHHPERGGQERQQAVFAVLQAAAPYLDNGRAPDGQMYFDHGSDSFLAEVIQILHIDKFEIAINNTRAPAQSVKITFQGYSETPTKIIRLVEFGRSYGECLFKIRKSIRELTGK